MTQERGVTWPSDLEASSKIQRASSAEAASGEDEPPASPLSKWKDRCKKFLHLPKNQKSQNHSLPGSGKAQQARRWSPFMRNTDVEEISVSERPTAPYNEAAAKELAKLIEGCKWRPPSPYPHAVRPSAPRSKTAPEIKIHPARNLSIVNEHTQQGDRTNHDDQNWFLRAPET